MGSRVETFNKALKGPRYIYRCPGRQFGAMVNNLAHELVVQVCMKFCNCLCGYYVSQNMQAIIRPKYAQGTYLYE